MSYLTPHHPYFEAVLAALGDNAAPDESFNEYCADDGEVMLTEIFIRLGTARARAAGYLHGLGLLWNQTTGWLWARGTNDDRLANPQPLVFGLVVTPASVASAVDALLTGRTNDLPAQGDEAAPGYKPLPEILVRAVAAGDLDHDTACRLASFA
ncbi:hypothetical protein ACFV4F_13610 [Kitasatospora sp. NPDC059722]|uniref:hypothetical protein n=1 Tax=Kitasatospora sp. NPDC059722 TaxID=3346925 RepID=UPI0036AD8B4B